MPIPENPLPACRYATNCVRVSQRYDVDADTLFARAQSALGALGPVELRSRPAERRAEAVDRVFVFKDDLALVVEEDGEGAVLHVRSASRVGRGDLGVNRRRVLRFLRGVDAAVGGDR